MVQNIFRRWSEWWENRKKIPAVHEDDLIQVLDELDLLSDLHNGNLSCSECDKLLTEDNVGYIFKIEGEIRLCCDQKSCRETAMKGAGGGD